MFIIIIFITLSIKNVPVFNNKRINKRPFFDTFILSVLCYKTNLYFFPFILFNLIVIYLIIKFKLFL
jgi:hypothetical protein